MVHNLSQPSHSPNHSPAAQTPKNSSPTEPVVIPGFAIPSGTFDINSGTALSLLLRASEAVVPFDPLHQPALDQLIDWANNTTYLLSLRLHTGEGGLGKTRLATELCLQLKDQDWQTGLLAKDQSTAQLTKLWQQLQLSQQPCLMVVDYAETQTAELLTLIDLIQTSQQTAGAINKTGQKVCLLLLARSGGEWWDNLASSEPQIEDLLIGPATTGPYEVKPLYYSLADIQQGFALALTAFAKVLGLNVPSVTPDLTPDHFNKPLYIQMAALLLLQGELPKTADGIHQALLNQEQRYWDAALKQTTLAQSNTNNMPRKLLALVTLAGHFATAKEAQKSWQIVDGSTISGQNFKQLFDCLTPLYPASQGLQAIKPDSLGEALVAEQLAKPYGGNLLTAVLGQGASTPVKSHALTVLGRLSLYQPAIETLLIDAFTQHLPHISQQLVTVAKATHSRLPQWAAQALSQLPANRQNTLAGQLDNLIEDDSVALNVLGCEVYRIIYEKAKKKASHKPKDIHLQTAFADTAYNYALSLNFIGNLQAAASIDKESLDIYEKLAQQHPELYQGDYALSLHNYSISLSNFGQHQAAVDTAKQALDIYKRLAQQQPDPFEPIYADSFYNYANHLRDLGQHQAAAEAVKQALDIYERLAQQRPYRYTPPYAQLLNSYGLFLRQLEQHQAAADATKQALDIYEQLAEHQLDRYTPTYAQLLNNYAICLSHLGQYQATADTAKQALDIYRRLAEQRPDHFEPPYAASLHQYAGYLNNLGQHQAAADVAKQALDMHERLAEQQPAIYEHYYALSLNNHALFLSNSGHYQAAANTIKQGLDILERLAEQQPERYESDYARLLHNYANLLSDLGQQQAATNRSKQALDIRERLAQQQPDSIEPDYAQSLNDYASHLADAGNYSDALAQLNVALAISSRLYQAEPHKHAFEFASGSLNYQFYQWFNTDATPITTPAVMADINQQLLARLLDHDKVVIQFDQIFGAGLTAQSDPERSAHFTDLAHRYNGFDISAQLRTERSWHCAALWLLDQPVANQTQQQEQGQWQHQWPAQWQAFKQRQQEGLPVWMIDFAKKCGLQWPD